MSPYRAQGLRRFAIGLPLFVFGNAWLPWALDRFFYPGLTSSLSLVLVPLVTGPLVLGAILVIAGLWASVTGERGRSRSALWMIVRAIFTVVCLLLLRLLSVSLALVWD